jgi:hypothetical protein
VRAARDACATHRTQEEKLRTEKKAQEQEQESHKPEEAKRPRPKAARTHARMQRSIATGMYKRLPQRN